MIFAYSVEIIPWIYRQFFTSTTRSLSHKASSWQTCNPARHSDHRHLWLAESLCTPFSGIPEKGS